MRRGRRLCDRHHLDKARWIAALVTLLSAGSAGALDPRDPCRGVRIQGLGQISCPQFNRIFETVSDLLAESVGRSLPLIAASAGFVYRYDPESDTFERETAIPGQLYLETPSPVGKDRWNLSFSYQYVAFDTFNGASLDALADTHPPIRLKVRSSAGPFVVPVTIPAFEIETQTHQLTLSATYGLTSELDLNLTLPVVYAESSTRGRGQILVGGEGVCPLASGCTLTQQQSSLGLGDVFLRGKLRLVRRPWAEIAGGLVLRLPTGDAEALQGSGTTEISPLLYAAGASLPLTAFASLRPYVNGGVNLDAEDVDQSEGRWGVGLDMGILNQATIGLGVLARYPFARTGAPGVFDVPRCRSATAVGCPKGPPAPLFGFENTRPNFYDASVGLRLNLWRDVLIGFANALVPLNDAGLRASAIPLAGIEGTF
jgi:hypothetical protein